MHINPSSRYQYTKTKTVVVGFNKCEITFTICTVLERVEKKTRKMTRRQTIWFLYSNFLGFGLGDFRNSTLNLYQVLSANMV